MFTTIDYNYLTCKFVFFEMGFAKKEHQPMDQQVSSDGFLRKSLSNVVQMGLRMPIGFM